jgi:uncharacterized membrane protein
MCTAVALACFVLIYVLGPFAEGFAQGLAMAIRPREASASIVLFIVFKVFAVWINTGQAIYFVSISRGRDASFAAVFTGGSYLPRVLGAGILFAIGLLLIMGVCLLPAGILSLSNDLHAAGLARIAGFCLTFVGGVAYSLVFFPCFYLIIDQDMGVFESLTVAARITSGNRLAMLGMFSIVGVTCLLLSLITCGVFLLAVLPYINTLFAVTYLMMIGQPTGPQSFATAYHP